MRGPIALAVIMLIAVAEPALAQGSGAPNYAAICKAASFSRHGPGTLSTTMRDAEIQRCIRNRGVWLDSPR